MKGELLVPVCIYENSVPVGRLSTCGQWHFWKHRPMADPPNCDFTDLTATVDRKECTCVYMRCDSWFVVCF